MLKHLTIRMTDEQLLRVATVAERGGMSKSDAIRALIERGMAAPAGSSEGSTETTEMLAAVLAVQDEQRAEIAALAKSITGTNEALRDLALAVQRLYQPAAPASQKTPAAAPGSIAVEAAKPPAYVVWAAGQPNLPNEDRETRIARLQREYKTTFGISA